LNPSPSLETHAEASVSVVSGVEPDFRLIPTLVIVAGFMPEHDRQLIQSNVSRRLGFDLELSEQEKLGFVIPRDFVRWEFLRSVDEIKKESIEAFIAPFNQQAFWESINSRVLLQQIPADPDQREIRIIILFENAERTSKDLLGALETELSKVGDPIAFSCVLIAIGASGLDPSKLTFCWPRLGLVTQTGDSELVKRDRVVEVCENLILALVSSTLIQKIGEKAGKNQESAKWIWVGASAIVSDVIEMDKYVHLSTRKQLIDPLLADTFSPGDQRWIDDWLQSNNQVNPGQIVMFDDYLWKNALSIAESLGWNIKPKPLSTRFAKIRRLLENLSQWLGLNLVFSESKTQATCLPIWPGEDLRNELAEPYRLAEDSRSPRERVYNPVPDLGKIIAREYQRLRDVLSRDILDAIADENNGYFSFLRNVSALFRPHDARTAFSNPSQDEKPSGFAAVTYATAAAAAFLRKAIIVNLREVVPNVVQGDYYLSAAIAEPTAEGVYAAFRRYLRDKNSILSPFGFVLKLIPAWPFLTALMIYFRHTSALETTILAEIVLFVFGVILYIAYKSSVEAHRRKFLLEQEQNVALAALDTMVRVIQDYRMMVVSHLQTIVYTLLNLRSVLEAEQQNCIRETTLMEGRFSDYDRVAATEEQSAIYNLANLPACQDWAGRACADSEDAFRILLVKEVFQRFRQSFTHVFNCLAGESDRAVDRVLDQGQLNTLEPHELIRQKPLLTDKGWWQWLDLHAKPVGGMRGADCESFTIVTFKNEALFSTQQGQVPNEWGKAKSCQKYEVGCVRGLIER